MDVAVDVVRYVALAWMLMVGPFNFAMLVRAVVHDRGYSISATDFMSGACLTALFVLGVPHT